VASVVLQKRYGGVERKQTTSGAAIGEGGTGGTPDWGGEVCGEGELEGHHHTKKCQRKRKVCKVVEDPMEGGGRTSCFFAPISG